MGAWKERRAAGAELDGPRSPRHGRRGEEETVDLQHALLEREDISRPLDQKLRPEAVSAHHLDRETADVADLGLAPAREESPFASHSARRRKRRHAVRVLRRGRERVCRGLMFGSSATSSDPGHLAAESNALDRRRRARSRAQRARTTSRSSVISRTA
jgi:hypothetical protein